MTNEDQTLDLGLDLPEASTPFPWPIATDPDRPPSSSHGIILAQTWPGLTPAERGLALFVGDGMGGPGTETNLCRALDLDRDALDTLLWGLLRKGYLAAVANWWTP